MFAAELLYSRQMILLGLIIVMMLGVVIFLVWQQGSGATPDRIAPGLSQMQRASRRLHFRRVEQGDKDFFLEMSADPAAIDANGWGADQTQAIRQHFENADNFARFQTREFVAVERQLGTPIGTITLDRSPFASNTYGLGVHVHPDHRRNGYGRELMAAGILLVQTRSGPLIVGTRVTNVGLQRIMEQLGYKPEPNTRMFVAPDGQRYESYWYSCGSDTHPPHGLFDD